MREHRTRTEETGVTSYRGNAIAAGVLFILCSAAAILSLVPLGAPVGAPVDFAWFAANGNGVVLTAVIEFVWAATGMGIAISLYPALRKFNPALALGSVVGRVVENAFLLVATLCLLAVLTVSQEAVAAGSAGVASAMTGSNLLLALRQWVHEFIMLIPFGVGTLLYNTVLYRSRLVPRWLSGWGIVAIVLAMVPVFYAAFTQEFGFTTINNVMNVPIALQEMTLAVWLIVKGFSPRALASIAGIRKAPHEGSDLHRQNLHVGV